MVCHYAERAAAQSGSLNAIFASRQCRPVR
jgi:hypothetical protein